MHWIIAMHFHDSGSGIGGIACGAHAVKPIMKTGHSINIAPGEAKVEVRLGDELLAATNRPVLLDETGLPTRYYLPRADVDMDRLRPTSFHTTCPFKGEASYWSVDIGGQAYDGIAWSYETPISAAAGIKGLVSFYPDRVQITVDGEPLNP
jgi:uncharacterized protein (DUF427 family)